MIGPIPLQEMESSVTEPAPSRPVAAPLRCSDQKSGDPDKNDESLGDMALEAQSLKVYSYDKRLNNLVGFWFRTYRCCLT